MVHEKAKSRNDGYVKGIDEDDVYTIWKLKWIEK